jgi:cell division septation protein DedD
VAAELRGRDERGRTARNIVLLFLLCVAVCAIFFSMGFMVGFNERGSHSAPATEVVSSPAAVPPTINPPPDGGQLATQDPSAGHGSPNAAPDTEFIPSNETSNAATVKPGHEAPIEDLHPAAARPDANPDAPVAGKSGEGLTLQVVALRNKQDAQRLVDLLKGKGYSVFLLTPKFSRADDNLFRVLVGPFKSHAEAEKAHDKLVQDGFKPFLRRS